MESGSLRRIERATAATQPTLDILLGRRPRGRAHAHQTSRAFERTSGYRKDTRSVCSSPTPDSWMTLPSNASVGSPPLLRSTSQETALSSKSFSTNCADAGGGGRTFVRAVKAYVETYSRRPDGSPPEHVLIFDEAQPAHDAAQVADVHKTPVGSSEPEHFIDFAERIPEWCVVVGLIGSGQEIYIGEEAGVGQWRDAITSSDEVIGLDGPCALLGTTEFGRASRLGGRRPTTSDDGAPISLVGDRPSVCRPAPRWCMSHPDSGTIASGLELEGYAMRVSRDLGSCRGHLRDRYEGDPDARFGMLASSRDRDLVRFGVRNDWALMKRLRYGPWFVEGDDDPLADPAVRFA